MKNETKKFIFSVLFCKHNGKFHSYTRRVTLKGAYEICRLIFLEGGGVIGFISYPDTPSSPGFYLQKYSLIMQKITAEFNKVTSNSYAYVKSFKITLTFKFIDMADDYIEPQPFYATG